MHIHIAVLIQYHVTTMLIYLHFLNKQFQQMSPGSASQVGFAAKGPSNWRYHISPGCLPSGNTIIAQAWSTCVT